MNWGSVGAFLDMGGKGFYVWGSYLVTAVLMAMEVWLVAQRRRAIHRHIRALGELGEGDAGQ
jgi:heme exporter protein D